MRDIPTQGKQLYQQSITANHRKVETAEPCSRESGGASKHGSGRSESPPHQREGEQQTCPFTMQRWLHKQLCQRESQKGKIFQLLTKCRVVLCVFMVRAGPVNYVKQGETPLSYVLCAVQLYSSRTTTRVAAWALSSLSEEIANKGHAADLQRCFNNLSFMAKQANRSRIKSSRDFVELFSPPRVTPHAQKMGLAVETEMIFDLQHGWDVREAKHRKAFRNHRDRHRPRMLMASPACRAKNSAEDEP